MSSREPERIQDTLCVILHYGSKQDTLDCLASILHEDFLEIVVVDNDPLQDFRVPAEAKQAVHIVRTGGAMGFAQANNLGVKTFRREHHRYVLILNNDTGAQKDSLNALRETMSDKEIGMAGPVMPYFDHPNTIWAAGGEISKWFVTIDGIRAFPAAKLTDVGYLPAACFLARLDLWDKIGGLPERYFLAFEEAEFALEVKRLGYRVVVDSDSIILHRVGMSSDRQPMYYYNTVRNRIRVGAYLWGDYAGPLLGAISGLARSYNLSRFVLWSQAVWDELRNRPLDKASLERIRQAHGKMKIT